MKNIFVIVSAFVFINFVITGCSSRADNSQIKPSTNFIDDEEKIDPNNKISRRDSIEIIYFHGNRRCYSCEIIENYTVLTLEEFFQPELKNKKITFQSVNGELPENRDIVLQYQARGSSLFINVVKDGKDNIEEDVQVWRLVSDEDRFSSYLKKKIEKYLQQIS